MEALLPAGATPHPEHLGEVGTIRDVQHQRTTARTQSISIISTHLIFNTLSFGQATSSDGAHNKHPTMSAMSLLFTHPTQVYRPQLIKHILREHFEAQLGSQEASDGHVSPGASIGCSPG
jgi:hypothetical protein